MVLLNVKLFFLFCFVYVFHCVYFMFILQTKIYLDVNTELLHACVQQGGVLIAKLGLKHGNLGKKLSFLLLVL